MLNYGRAKIKYNIKLHEQLDYTPTLINFMIYILESRQIFQVQITRRAAFFFSVNYVQAYFSAYAFDNFVRQQFIGSTCIDFSNS